MPLPGANTAVWSDRLEKLDTRSVLVVEDTAMALEMHAGAPMESVKPLLPAEITVAMPELRRLSMAALRWGSWLSQSEKCRPPPRLMFAEIGRASCRERVQVRVVGVGVDSKQRDD